ncbi:MAG TPA: hypothetical protein VF914_08885 [Chloroflexia bacterium]|jgi:hypothetical protein
MDRDWLAHLDTETAREARKLIAQMEVLGAPDAEEWVYSEITEDIPQVARYLVLRRIWESIDAWVGNSQVIMPRLAAESEKDPEGHFADAGRAVKRMLQAGISPEDIGRVARLVSYDTAFAVLEIIDEGGYPEADDTMPGWSLVETKSNGEYTGRHIGSLHESLLGLDPKGREGRPAQP